MGINIEFFYVVILALFSGIIIHEYGHALIALLLGIKIKKIHFFPRSSVETEKIDDANIRILIGFSGGFFACLFLLTVLLIFPFKSIVYSGYFQLNGSELGLFFCLIHLIGGIIEGFFPDLYSNNRLYLICVIILSFIVYYLFYYFF